MKRDQLQAGHALAAETHRRAAITRNRYKNSSSPYISNEIRKKDPSYLRNYFDSIQSQTFRRFDVIFKFYDESVK